MVRALHGLDAKETLDLSREATLLDSKVRNADLARLILNGFACSVRLSQLEFKQRMPNLFEVAHVALKWF